MDREHLRKGVILCLLGAALNISALVLMASSDLFVHKVGTWLVLAVISLVAVVMAVAYSYQLGKFDGRTEGGAL